MRILHEAKHLMRKTRSSSMRKVKAGQTLPNLKGTSYSSGDVSLQNFQGSPLILSFYRYAACPFCNLRVHQFIQRYQSDYSKQGINAIAVFQSPLNSISKYLSKHDAPFDIIADPQQHWYKAMGLSTSWLGFMSGAANLSQAIQAKNKGFMKINPEGPANRLPADFLIGSDGTIEVVYYAKNISDHIPFGAIDRWTDKVKV